MSIISVIIVAIVLGVAFGLFGKKVEAFNSQIRDDLKGTTVDVKFRVIERKSTVRQKENLEYMPAPILSIGTTSPKTSIALIPRKREEHAKRCENYFFLLENEDGQSVKFVVNSQMWEQYREGDEIIVQKTTRKNFFDEPEIIYRYDDIKLPVVEK